MKEGRDIIMEEKRENVSFEMKKNESKDWNNIKNTIQKLHNENKNDVPVYLDNLKKEKHIEVKEATYENEFLKYML